MIEIKNLLLSIIRPIGLFVTTGTWKLNKTFNNLYKGQIKSQTFRNIFRDVYGDDYAEEADPSSFVTITDLRRFANSISLEKDDAIVDLACGCGGPGLWIARQIGANLTGIDISTIAIDQANKRINDFGLSGKAHFQLGDFTATGLPDAEYDGAISVDALVLVINKAAALREVARILRKGAYFVFTTWEGNFIELVKDHHSLLTNAGFSIEVYEETKDWEPRQRAVYERILAEKDTLIEEMGKSESKGWLLDARLNLRILKRMHRIFVVARKK